MRVSSDISIQERYRKPLSEDLMGYFRDPGFDPNYIERDSRKRKFIDGIRDLTARRWDSPKSWHGVRYWERKRNSGNSGIVEVRDVGLS